MGYYKHLLKLPQQFFDTMRVGEIISRVNDAVKIRVFINNVSLDIVVNILIVLFTLVIMFVFSWKLALVVCVAIPLYSVIYLIFNRLNKKLLRKIMENSAELESQLVESISAVSTIKRFGIEDFSNLKTETRFVKLLKTTYQSSRNSIITGSCNELLAGLITIAIFWYGATKVIDQSITPGTLISFYTLLGYLTSPLASLITSNQSIQDALIAADRLFQIMDLEHEETQDEKIEIKNENIGDIEFSNVNFRYGSRATIFENLTLTIKKGQTTAIIGESGSGKTTMMSLLQNIYPIQSGFIKIGGYDIKHIKNQSLRNVIATVPQNIDLFFGTIVENIAIGDLEPDFQKIVDICTKLNINKMIEALPNGYFSLLGEFGVSLSGGEKQKIAIARALYKEPQILILDEATSSLDNKSERFIQNTINKLKDEGITVIIIAHRLSTIVGADKIIYLENGIVIEEGTHDELLEKRSKYYELVNGNI